MIDRLKYLAYRAQFTLAPHIETRFPTHVDIELAGKCNLRCTMCPYGDNGDGTGSFDESRQGMMSENTAILALIHSDIGGAKSIKLNFRGEPGLSPLLIDCVAFAKTFSFVEVAINTNLTAFSQRRLGALCDAGLDLMIVSIDGATKETYESIRIKGDYDKLMKNLSYVAGHNPRPRIRLQMVVQDSNKDEVQALRKQFSAVADEIIFQPERSLNTGERKRCPQPWQRLIVAWDGKVFACCSNWETEFPVGQFPEQTLEEIWRDSRQLQELRFRATHFQEDPCKHCKVGVSYK